MVSSYNEHMFTDPKRNIEQFGLTSGMKVADLGAGSGFYTIEAARHVGESGRVFAIDVQKELLEKIKKDAYHEHLFNVEVIWGDLEKVGGTRLQDGSMDAVIVSNVLFQIQDKNQFFDEITRILKPNRQVLLVDWAENILGPEKNAIVTEAAAKKLFQDKGFTFESNINAGNQHYGLVFKKPGRNVATNYE